MNTTIPVVRSASLFVANHDDVCEPMRTVSDYELEYCITDGGISQINGIFHHIKKGCVIIAKHLLINTKSSLSKVAEKCGFRSQAYFSDCFRRKTDSTPSQFHSQTSYKL